MKKDVQLQIAIRSLGMLLQREIEVPIRYSRESHEPNAVDPRGTTCMLPLLSDFVARILHLCAPYKVFLDASHAHKPRQQILAASFVVRTA